MKSTKKIMESGSLRQKCIKFGVDYEKIRKYRYNHPELTDEQVIIHYRPELRLNIFGEIIEK